MNERSDHERRLGRAFEGPEADVFRAVLSTADLLLGDLAGLLQGHGLSPSLYDALCVLARAGTDGCSTGEVAARMWTRAPDVTRLLDRLETQGLVDRERSTEDRRIVVARLTRLGDEVLRTLDAPVASLHREQLGHLSVDALGRLRKALERAQQGGPQV